ncbi:uncharacterized protein K460DRAFT_384324 [Cucurbitaria berberidis CBS 394.84]|uniref:Uncharacterized protein n=1 Tax=Cucurbitaria berberidis CBS 394.84 TaxID=1168544 RepID=A0A9P4LB41_9PLEO|nr:uncharacterized protein K460DRAFT_384324 [Cucurbitaria berberidis CBS 394.84]KAF1848123.1 hypothetical protein K460DRAFT_384324 [Cucurbitaria berberidis CBS 394.84]
MLDAGVDRDMARKMTRDKIETVLREWGYTEDLSWYFRCEKNFVCEETPGISTASSGSPDSTFTLA